MPGHGLCLLAYIIAYAIVGACGATQRIGNDGQSRYGRAVNIWVLDIFGLPCNIGQRCHGVKNLLAFFFGDTGMPACDMIVDLGWYNREFTLPATDNLVINIMAEQPIKCIHGTIRGSTTILRA